MQKNVTSGLEKDKVRTDSYGWKYTYDGEFYRNCYVKKKTEKGNKVEVVDGYGEIEVPLESLLNYLIANSTILYVMSGKQNNK